MESIRDLGSVEKIITGAPFIFYMIVLCIGIINSQLEMTATFMFGTIILYVLNTIVQFASTKLDINRIIPTSNCQFFVDHVFYQSYHLPSFSSSFLWFLCISLLITIGVHGRFQVIGIISIISILLVLYPMYSSCFSTRKDKLLNLFFTMMIGGGVAILYYYVIIHISMKRSEYLLFSRPLSNRGQCIPIPIVSVNQKEE